jgi:hypothetical protein
VKVSFHEYDAAFSIEFSAEDAKDASVLARFAMNTRSKPPIVHVSAGNQTLYGFVSFAKRIDFQSRIGRPKQ